MAVDGLLPYDIRVEGVRLNNYAYNVSLASGLSQIPQRALIGVPGPRRDETVPIAGRYNTPPQYTLTAWISDSKPDGSQAANPDMQYEQNKAAFLAAFVSQSATITVERCMPDGTIRVAECRVAASVIPEDSPAGGSSWSQVTIVLDNPGIYWVDSAGSQSQTYSAFGAATQLTFLSGATAPITDSIITVPGPITNPRISNTYGGYAQYNGPVPSGSTWAVNSKKFTSKIDSTSVLSKTDYYHNAGYLFEMWPNYTITVDGTGTSGQSWTIQAVKKYF